MTESTVSKGNQYIVQNYGRYPKTFVKGEKAYLYDDEGKRYDDFLAGIAVVNLGYSNENYKNALKDQIDNLMHTSNYYWIEPQVELAEKLCKHSFAEQAFFCNSGGEANEAALKIARRYHYLQGKPEKNEFIWLSKSFHGRTLATLALTSNPTYREGFEPLPTGFIGATFNDIESVKAVISDKTAAVFIEPIQGEGGVHPADPDFLKGLRALCDEYGALLVFDEVQCGMGRTGTLFAYEGYRVTPDIMTLAKGLGNGMPIGAMVTTKEIGKTFTPGTHGTTFGGNHLATRAGCAVMDELTQTDLLDQVKAKGDYFRKAFEGLMERTDKITGVRGLGLMNAVDFTVNAKELNNALLDQGFLISATSETTLRFVPPFVIEEEQIDRLVSAIENLLK